MLGQLDLKVQRVLVDNKEIPGQKVRKVYKDLLDKRETEVLKEILAKQEQLVNKDSKVTKDRVVQLVQLGPRDFQGPLEQLVPRVQGDQQVQQDHRAHRVKRDLKGKLVPLAKEDKKVHKEIRVLLVPQDKLAV